ncbi:hypothetical protein EVAR_4769_1 [Eumeta japonica]|uniref:Uncharacterized protein n=1 Tax=Eumeta variegata TaxID=151549 RepID=A0A4C1SZT3_EUMVA|nr:hypothetical protein EVAR_4769_1 [Eumeta japonica]
MNSSDSGGVTPDVVAGDISFARPLHSQSEKNCCARGRPIIVEWERDARHSAGLSLVVRASTRERGEALKALESDEGERNHNVRFLISLTNPEGLHKDDRVGLSPASVTNVKVLLLKRVVHRRPSLVILELHEPRRGRGVNNENRYRPRGIEVRRARAPVSRRNKKIEELAFVIQNRQNIMRKIGNVSRSRYRAEGGVFAMGKHPRLERRLKGTAGVSGPRLIEHQRGKIKASPGKNAII